MKTLQRVIFPSLEQTDTAPLYVDTGVAAGIQLSHNISSLGNQESLQQETKANAITDNKNITDTKSGEPHIEDFMGRLSTIVRAGKRFSFATYFNAFPASYWKRWTTLTSVRLHIETEGTGTIIVYKSNARGSLQRVDSKRVEGDETSDFDLTLKPFGDGGWYWFELVAGNQNLKLRSAEWQGEDNGKEQGKTTLQITTMNKQEFCLNNMRSLGRHPEILDLLKEVLIVDQGSQKLQNEADFEEVASLLKGKLRIINQDNLGGSGGFARGMYEAVENGSDYVLLLDDDVVIEPESIARLLTFAGMCRKPTIVGGHMFDLYNRTVLHTFGEVMNKYRIQPDLPNPGSYLGHDFMHSNLRTTPWLHRRADVDYNGWWMDLIPTSVIKEIGLSLPIFIKWDDVEYGVRAREAGYQTVSLPGAAVWHVSWVDKDDLVGWQAYFHIRNRIITAMLHSPYERGGRVLRESVYADVKHLVSMQYFTEHGRIMALRDILQGPDQLHTLLSKRLPDIRALVSQYSDAQFIEDIDKLPEPKLSKPLRNGRDFTPPSYSTLAPWAAKTVVRQLFKPIKDEYKKRPQTHVAHIDNRWWLMSQYDSALVSNAEGTAISWYKRNPDHLRSMLVESAKLTAQILKQWPALRKQYQDAAKRITSIEEWKKTFEAHTESEITR